MYLKLILNSILSSIFRKHDLSDVFIVVSRCYPDPTDRDTFDIFESPVSDITRIDGSNAVIISPNTNPGCQLITVNDLGLYDFSQLVYNERKARQEGALRDGQPEPLTVEQYESAFPSIEQMRSKRYLTMLFKWVVGKGKLLPISECQTWLFQPGMALVSEECLEVLQHHQLFE